MGSGGSRMTTTTFRRHHRDGSPSAWKLATRLAGLLALALAAWCCGRPSSSAGGAAGTANTAGGADETRPHDANAVELLFTYGSEKEEWIKDVTARFNDGAHQTASGKPIYVQAVAEGSGEAIDELLGGSRKADLVSPASAAFIKLGNAESRTKTGKDLIATTQNLVLSPVVIAMWKPMAEALGWGARPVGWSDILDLAHDPRGWAGRGHPEWGAFKLGHTHPEYSNSGLISLLAEAYAAVGKVGGLTLAEVQRPETERYVAGIESAIVHYGSSTGFFGKKMFEHGPQYLSAAVLYESLVIESTLPKYQLPFPVVAIYPKEGTFWSDHPVGVVEREWVTPEHRDAAKVYVDYLLARPQQERALQFGFRPAAVEIPLTAPIDAAHGVDPKQPQTTLEVPPVEVIDAVRQLWHQAKKRSQITLVLDTSGSMNEEQKLENAKAGAEQLLKLLDADDTFSFLPFNDQLAWAVQDLKLGQARDRALATLGGVFASGGTALYDSIAAAYDHQRELAAREPGRISAVVVLTDGEDTDSKLKLGDLLGKLVGNRESRGIPVFTIGYGRDANRSVLERIAVATGARFYEGNPANIRSVFTEISTFF
jgi:Ca-activated chloride channel homolog